MSERRARAARRFGSARSQHFLRTRELAAWLVRDAELPADALVLDLGAGSGRLTAELARAAARVVAVELDPALAARLRGRWPNVDVVERDAARVELPSEPFRVVANLPFDRTTELLRKLLDDPRTPLVRADLVVEWGVALKRALPHPSTATGVRWAAWYRFAVERRLPPTAFAPPPRVAAGVLVIRRRTDPLVPPAEAGRYAAFVARGFRRGLRSVAPARVLRRHGYAAAAPRDLDAHQWAALYRIVSGGAGGGARRRGAGAGEAAAGEAAAAAAGSRAASSRFSSAPS